MKNIACLCLALTLLSTPNVLAQKTNVQSLIKQLKDNDESVRLKAAKDLSKLGAKAKDAIPALKAAAQDSDADVRAMAEKALQKIQAKANVKLAALKEGKVEYLSDMDEFDVNVAEERFAKKGDLGYLAGNPQSGRILVKGKESPNGLSMHAISNAYSSVKYRLGGTAKTLMASVALNDSAGAPGEQPGVGKIPTPLTFQVFGDGKMLWKSKPVNAARNIQDCKVDVTGIKVLELRVDCPGAYTNAQSVWLEPRVLK